MDPEELAARLVHADELQARGDPRGELITVQAARENDSDDPDIWRREEELLDAHADALLGPWRESFEIRWHLGYWFSLRFPTDAVPIADFERAVREILEHPSARELRELTLGFSDGFEAVARVLQSCVAPGTLRRLTIREQQIGRLLSFPNDFDPAVLSAVTHLSLDASRVRFTRQVTFPAAESVYIQHAVHRTHDAILSQPWPHLRTLGLGLSDLRTPWPTETYPALQSLSLSTWSVGQAVESLAAGGLLPQLDLLSFAPSTLTPRDLEPLRTHAAALREVGDFVLSSRVPTQRTPAQVVMVQHDFDEITRLIPHVRWVA